MNMVILYALGIWLILVIAAILNAGLRESLITPRIGQHAGHVISTITLICIILLITYLFLSNLNMSYNQTDLILVGTLWLVLTIGFEFGFGHYVMGHSWDKLLADYNLFKGRVWILVPLTTFIVLAARKDGLGLVFAPALFVMGLLSLISNTTWYLDN